MPDNDELSAIRDENESLAAFLHMLQREYNQLHADFAAVLRTMGGQARVEAATYRPLRDRIERDDDPMTGALTFRLTETSPTP